MLCLQQQQQRGALGLDSHALEFPGPVPFIRP